MRVLVVCMCLVACVIGQPQQVDPQEPQPQTSVVKNLQQPFNDIPLKTLFDHMNDPTTVKFYVECITETGSCDKIGNALQNLIYDQQRAGQFCHGCTKCERERVQYVMDKLKTDYRDLACKIQQKLRWVGLFGDTNPCA
ncbi:uncharacterized protein [Panulirus ornatus]|uniref:uncharacterized protein n=1 Tax=Panulirus ornatus TaxID=150431 RepID=UPI003A8C854B